MSSMPVATLQPFLLHRHLDITIVLWFYLKQSQTACLFHHYVPDVESWDLEWTEARALWVIFSSQVEFFVIGTYISSINPDFDFQDIQELHGSAERSILSYYRKGGTGGGSIQKTVFWKAASLLPV